MTPIPTHCRVCGRAVVSRQSAYRGAGRPREVHQTCMEVASMLSRIESKLSVIQFADEQHVRRLRGDLFCLVNGPLRRDRVLIAPNSTEDF